MSKCVCEAYFLRSIPFSNFNANLINFSKLLCCLAHFSPAVILFSQNGYFIFNVLNGRENADKSPIYNFMVFDDKISVNEWHNFCTSVNIVKNIALVAQNGKIIAERGFKLAHNEVDRMRKLMPFIVLGGYTGYLADVQVFSRPLTPEEMEDWTLCKGSSQV